MKLRIACNILLLLLLACSPYKQLKPKPDIIPQETEYAPFLNKDKKFELKENKKYYVEFPGIRRENFYLALKISEQDALDYYFTHQFNKGNQEDVKIPDESTADDAFSVYDLDQTASPYYWVIEDVKRNLHLDMAYRYVPQWRFRFETRSAELQLNLAKNKIDRDKYESLGITISTDDFNYERELADLRLKTQNLQTIQNELKEIENILPETVKSTDDRAYLNYVGLKDELQKEIQFQKNYQLMLKAFQREKETRYDRNQFVASIPEFLPLFQQLDRHPDNVRQEACRIIGDKIANSAPDYDKQLRSKRDVSVINFPTADARAILQACDIQPDEQFVSMVQFIDSFNESAGALETADKELAEIRRSIQTGQDWPSNDFYPGLQRRVSSLRASLSSASARFYGKYASYPCVSLLDQESRRLQNELERTARDFQRAGNVVAQVNRYRTLGNYKAITALLKENNDLDFLADQYGSIDQLSLDQQGREISNAMQEKNWTLAEKKLIALHEDQNFINYSAIASRKARMVQDYENELAKGVEQASKERIASFIELNKSAYNNVDSLYNSSAFRAVHDLSFSASGARTLENRKRTIQNYLDGFKYDQFPKMAIENLYREFSQNPHDNGVAKARAIIKHGKYYQGSDRQIKNLVAEVDPMTAKWITRPKEYRKIFVLPTNEKQQGSNAYLFRLNIKIPSDAQFPVYDVNIKLPQEVAKDAGERQWYEAITLNNKVLKNEGRFSITAPTKDNDYVCQITPLQVSKNSDNILEVRFKLSAFKVLEVSTMAQRPIIKKN